MSKKMRIRCKSCNKLRLRLSIIGLHKRQTYISSNGDFWLNSDVCSICKKELARELKEFKNNREGNEPPEYWNNKNCDKCGGRLQLARYKTCVDCKPTLGRSIDLYGSELVREKLDFKMSELPLLAGGVI